MEREIDEFITFLHVVKKTTLNTELSYRRDLLKLQKYLQMQGIQSTKDITTTVLNSYILDLEKHGFAVATISRNIASIKAFMQYLIRKGKGSESVLQVLKSPKVEKKAPEILTKEEMFCLLEQPDLKTNKGIRDRAMLELLYATGVRVTELVSLKVSDVNLKLDYITCRDIERERSIPLGREACLALERYLKAVRPAMCKGNNKDLLFFNCSGSAMSRQGFWKLVKHYAKRAGIMSDITPHTIRHSFAAHLVENGAELKVVQEMLGHADISATQIYVSMNQKHMRDVYLRTHPRK